MPTWVTKDMRKQMTSIAREDEKYLEALLKKTQGNARDGLDSLDDDELFVLYCHFQTYRELEQHCGLHHTAIVKLYNNRGFSSDEMRNRVVKAMAEVSDEVELEGLE